MKSLHFKYFRVLLLLLLAGQALHSNAQLNGSYTIGSGGNYPTIEDAINDLEAFGINAPVIFNILDGEYTEHVTLNNFTGSEQYGVTFQSLNGNPEDVVFKDQHFEPGILNYNIYFRGAKNITFKNITFLTEHQQDNLNFGNRSIYISNKSENLTFEGNIIKSWKTFETNFLEKNLKCNVYIGSDNGVDSSYQNDNITFYNNEIIGGMIGIYAEGLLTALPADKMKNITVESSSFSEQQIRSIEVSSCRNLVCLSNDILLEPILALEPQYGIIADNILDSLQIHKNRIKMPSYGEGIAVNSHSVYLNGIAEIYNNSITLGPDGSVPVGAGIGSENNDSLSIFFNSILIDEAVPNCYGINSVGIDNLKLLNNHLVINSTGACINSDNAATTTLIASDYNNFSNQSGGAIATINGTNYNTVSDLNIGLGVDSNSSELNPDFMSNTLLHPLNSSVFNTGTPLNEVNLDFYGTTRSLSTPDIGFFEGELSNLDAGLLSINLEDNFLLNCAEDSIEIFAEIKNYGTSNLSSTDIIVEIEGAIVLNFQWSGNLTFGQSSGNVNIGKLLANDLNGNFTKCWVENPNSGTDQLNLNDTIYCHPQGPLAGEYTIGENKDFETINASIEAMENYGICSSVIFKIDSGYYNEKLLFSSFLGSSSENTIIYESVTGDSMDVVIEASSNSSFSNYVIKFDGAHHMWLRNMTIRSIGASFHDCILLDNNADNNKLTNLVIEDLYNGNTFGDGNLIYLLNGIDSTLIDNIHFISGQNQILIDGGSSSNGTGTIISNNVMSGNCYRSIDVLEQTNIKIINNSFTGLRVVSNICIENVAGNDIEISNNTANVSGHSGIGVKLINVDGTYNSQLKYHNNLWSTNFYGNGLDNATGKFEHCNFIDVINNSFSLTGDQGYTLTLEFNASMNFYNNVVYNDSEGRLMKCTSVDSSLLHSDHNVYYVHSSNYFFQDTANINFRSGTTEYSFNQWQDSTGLDTLSVYEFPSFVSAQDLHVNNSGALSGNAIPFTTITVDVDNEFRDLITPDIGGDEFDIDSTTYRDIELLKIVYPDSSLCTNNDSLVLEIINHSFVAIDSFVVRWWFSENLVDSNTVIASILPNDTAIVFIQEYDFNENTFYQIDIEIDYPDGIKDNLYSNNDMNTDYSFLGDFEIHRIERLDCPESELELCIKSFPRESLLWSTGETSQRITPPIPGIYSVEVVHINGCTFNSQITLE